MSELVKNKMTDLTVADTVTQNSSKEENVNLLKLCSNSNEEKIAEENVSDQNGDTNVPDVKLSKRQMKKIQKKEKWMGLRAEMRKKEREKKKAKRQSAKLAGEDLGPSRKSLKKNKMCDSKCKTRVVIDCSFDDLMVDKEIASLCKQLGHCYSANRRSPNPLQLYVTSLGGQMKKRLEEIAHFQFWDVHFCEQNYLAEFKKEEVVYLCSESPNILKELQDEKVYVIGGLVDHNHHKGFSHQRAVDNGLAHAQLPIGKYLHLKTRQVLAVNHVFEILADYVESGNWETAFDKVVPKRKFVDQAFEHVKEEECESSDNSDNSDNSGGGADTAEDEPTKPAEGDVAEHSSELTS